MKISIARHAIFIRFRYSESRAPGLLVAGTKRSFTFSIHEICLVIRYSAHSPGQRSCFRVSISKVLGGEQVDGLPPLPSS